MSRQENALRLTAAIAAAGALLVVILGIGYRNATAAPIVRRLTVELPDYPARAPPLRIALFSDIHVHGPDMPPSRLRRIVAEINALHPDVDVIAGDFIGNNLVGADYPLAEAVAPLAGLKSRFGAFAVLGNNDHLAGAAAVTRALEAVHVGVLNDRAVRLGPIALGGLDDRYNKSGKAVRRDEQLTFSALARTAGAKVLVAHGPDQFPQVPGRVHLMLAGHTHCGQIVLPLIGPLVTGSDYGRKYVCGIVRKGAQMLIVTAGLGTSHVPLRYGAPPDVWLIELRGKG